MDAFQPSGRVLAKENGEVLHPANVTRRCVERYEEIGLPPVRLPDLHHGAAPPAHAAGLMLGHSSFTIAADMYTSLLPVTE